MSVIEKLTLRHLKMNKGRTVITALGICVSVAMITAVFVAVASYMNFNRDLKIFHEGNWHFSILQADSEQLEALKENELIENVGLQSSYGDFYTMSFRLLGEKSNVSDGMLVGDEVYFEQMVTCAYDGEFPKNDSEIAVEAKFLEENGLDWKIGDTVTLSIGTWYKDVDNGYWIHDTEDDFSGSYASRSYSNEPGEGYTYFEDGIRQFKLVGILHDNRPTYTNVIRGLSENELYHWRRDFSHFESTSNGIDALGIDIYRDEITDDIINRYISILSSDEFVNKLYEYSLDKEIIKKRIENINDEQFIKDFIGDLTGPAVLETINTYVLANYWTSSTMTVTLKNPNYKSLYEIDEILETIFDDKNDAKTLTIVNYDLLETYFAVDENSEVLKTVIPLGLAILAIICVASVVLIYNAFAMSLSEKTRYLGMLGSVGATKKQKRQSVYFEGFVLGAVSIPIGLLIGTLGITAMMKTMSGVFEATGMIENVSDSALTMKTVVPLWAVAGIVAFSALTIFISSVIPAKRASAITPIELIRQNREIRIDRKKLKQSRLIRFIFGSEGELAHKNLKRNGKKSQIIIGSIALSVAVFLSVNYFCAIFSRVENLDSANYQLSLKIKYQDKTEIENAILAIEEVDDIITTDHLNFNLSQYTNSYSGHIRTDEVLTDTYKNLWNDPVTIYVNIINDEEFNSLCEKNGIDPAEYYQGGFKAVMMNNISHRRTGAKVFNENVIGKEISKFKDDENAVKVGALLDYSRNDYLCNLNPIGTVSAYMPESVYYSVSDNDEGIVALGIVTDDHEYAAKQINAIFEQGDYEIHDLTDLVAEHEEQNTRIFVLQVFLYGFIALITLITLANIVNTISTSITSRRREFAMYKSVGITKKGFYKMMCLESIFYGLNALLFSLPVSILASFIMNKTVGDGKIPFEIDYGIYIAVILTVFAIIGFSMLYSLSKLKEDSIVATLSEDIS